MNQNSYDTKCWFWTEKFPKKTHRGLQRKAICPHSAISFICPLSSFLHVLLLWLLSWIRAMLRAALSTFTSLGVVCEVLGVVCEVLGVVCEVLGVVCEVLVCIAALTPRRFLVSNVSLTASTADCDWRFWVVPFSKLSESSGTSEVCVHFTSPLSKVISDGVPSVTPSSPCDWVTVSVVLCSSTVSGVCPWFCFVTLTDSGTTGEVTFPASGCLGEVTSSTSGCVGEVTSSTIKDGGVMCCPFCVSPSVIASSSNTTFCRHTICNT